MHARALAFISLLASTLAAQQRTPASATPIPPCPINQLTLTSDDQDGEFNGMQQSGTLLVLRNTGHSACSIQPIPRTTLFDRRGKPLPIAARLPGARGMHPGPVVLPISIAPGAELVATLHWITGPVFEHSVCHRLATLALTLTVEGQQLRIPFAGEICGEHPNTATYDITRFAPDPTYKPSQR